jgi:hypothetical protein
VKDLVVAKQLSLNIFGDNFELLPNGLIIHGKPTVEEYDEAFRRLSLIESATSWWYGDLANARERDYGSLKEMAERLEINYNSLRNYQAVASSYELHMRMCNLSFYHHQIATPLEDRLEWLKKAGEGLMAATKKLAASIDTRHPPLPAPATDKGLQPLSATLGFLEKTPGPGELQRDSTNRQGR